MPRRSGAQGSTRARDDRCRAPRDSPPGRASASALTCRVDERFSSERRGVHMFAGGERAPANAASATSQRLLSDCARSRYPRRRHPQRDAQSPRAHSQGAKARRSFLSGCSTHETSRRSESRLRAGTGDVRSGPSDHRHPPDGERWRRWVPAAGVTSAPRWVAQIGAALPRRRRPRSRRHRRALRTPDGSALRDEGWSDSGAAGCRADRTAATTCSCSRTGSSCPSSRPPTSSGS